MKKFSFPLESVLKYRKHIQKQAELDLGKALAAEKKIENQLQELASQKVSMNAQVRGLTDFNEITKANRFYEFLEQQKNYLLAELTKAKLVSEKKRTVLREAMKKTNSLQKLRDKLFADYKNESLTEDFNIADDMTNARSARKINL